VSAPPRAAVVLGTRGSALARAQTERVLELLREAWPGLQGELREIVTEGDRTQANGRPLPEIGGKGLFTAELESALREGGVDFAVHSLKDLPTAETPGIAIGAVAAREDVRDCLLARDGLLLQELPPGAVVGTSSLRRAAQVRGMRHDVEVRSIRGNVDTRVRKVKEGKYDAVVVAAAGIRRLGLDREVAEWFEPDVLVPAPGQGALAVQCRADDEAALELLSRIDDPRSRAESTAERAFLSELDAGCTAPVGAYAEAILPQGALYVRLRGLVASPDGRDVVRVEGDGAPEEVGARLAHDALRAGAFEILEAIRG
jgi:hydroxymethylbilane synthase